jgi:hypothetical protein
MAKIIHKDFKDLRKGDKVLVELVVESDVIGSGYVIVGAEDSDRGLSFWVKPDKYHGCIAPPPRDITIGMKFWYNRGAEVAQIYHIDDEGRVYCFNVANPTTTIVKDVYWMPIDSSIEWVE